MYYAPDPGITNTCSDDWQSASPIIRAASSVRLASPKSITRWVADGVRADPAGAHDLRVRESLTHKLKTELMSFATMWLRNLRAERGHFTRQPHSPSGPSLAPSLDNVIIIGQMAWKVEFHPECEAWADTLDQQDGEALLAAIRLLHEKGPALPRPLVDTVKGSEHANMKELRHRIERPYRDPRALRLRHRAAGNSSRRWRQERKLAQVVSREHSNRGCTLQLPSNQAKATTQGNATRRQAQKQKQKQKQREAQMSLKQWEKKILKAPGAKQRVDAIEEELRLAMALTELRESAGLSQRELAARMGVSQPRVAAIEKCQNATIHVLSSYVGALGGRLEFSVIKAGKRIPLASAPLPRKAARRSAKPAKRATANAEKAKSTKRRA